MPWSIRQSGYRKPDAACDRSPRQSLAVLLATTALGVVSAHAVDATWVGGNAGDVNEWVEPNNWTGTTVPDGIATFTDTGVTTVANDNGIVIIGELLFTAAPNAQAYTININNPFIVNALGDRQQLHQHADLQRLVRKFAGVPERQLGERRHRARSQSTT